VSVRRVVVAAVGVALLAAGLASVLRSPSSIPAPAAAAGVPPTEAPPPAAVCPPIDGPASDHDGDGCPSAVSIDGGVVVVEGTRYGVGEAGDALAVADWDCDGAATVAAVRPATGELFVFGGWAEPGADVVVPAAARVPGGARPEAVDDGDGCPSLVVVGVDGRRTEVQP